MLINLIKEKLTNSMLEGSYSFTDYMDIYKEQGKEALLNALGMTDDEFEDDINEIAFKDSLNVEEDREEIIARVIEDKVLNESKKTE